jgi:hypothetical protein
MRIVWQRVYYWRSDAPKIQTRMGGTCDLSASLAVRRDVSSFIGTGRLMRYPCISSHRRSRRTFALLFGFDAFGADCQPQRVRQRNIIVDTSVMVSGLSAIAVPDISALGDPNVGYLIGETQTFPDGSVKYSEYRIGGTSLSVPLVAGIMALADECAGRPRGFANPLFYSLAGSAAFNDIVSPASTVAVVRTNHANSVDASGGLQYRLRTMNQTPSLHATSGYDDVTGLGTPASSFLNSVCH